MIEATHWHPVALAEDCATSPLAVRLLGQDLVLWRDGAGAINAWADRCPHRGARLSLGRVVFGQLECGYHGWRFATSGQCVKVPALPTFEPPATHCATRFEAQEAYGLVWARLAPGEIALPRFEAEFDGRLRKLNCGPYDVATSAPRIVENFLDMAHFGLVHEGLLGARDALAIDEYQVEATATGLLATGCKAWQPQSNLHSTALAQVSYRYEVVAPFGAVLGKEPPTDSVALAGYRESIALFICPLLPESSRVWFRLAVADFKSSDAALRAFQQRIFLQDQPVLESQSPRCLPLDARLERHTLADKASSMYRRHLKSIGATFGVIP
jgi:phenylpropionate dioxygenase-like ring-hydroxylating dioxygenase large terminal subunit